MPKSEKIMPTVEVFGLDLPAENMQSSHVQESVAGSSQRNLKSSFIGMGFLPSLVDKVVEEKGEDDFDLLLETLFAYSALQKPQSESSGSFSGFFGEKKDETAAESHQKEIPHKSNCESSDSLDFLFGDDNDTSTSPNMAANIYLKEEIDVHNGFNDEKRASLLTMDFSLDEVNFAMDRLGEDAPMNELVDFILAARISENQTQEKDDRNQGNVEHNKDTTTESFDGALDKKLWLLEMGFSESQISATIQKYGSEVPVSELADLIFADKVSGSCSSKNKSPLTSFSRNCSKNIIDGMSWFRRMEGVPSKHSVDLLTARTEESCPSAFSQSVNVEFEKCRGKRPKEELVEDMRSLKRPKKEFDDESSIVLGQRSLGARKGESKFTSQRELLHKVGRVVEMPQVVKPKSCKSVDQMVTKPPYFFYGNVMNLSQECWMKISRFLYAVEPEFANTQFFSALIRKEGYIHNLPSGNRFHIKPKSPMTIEEAIPQTKKWCPSWDTRKQLSCISSETTGILQLCDRLGKMLNDSKGLLSLEQQRDLLYQCKSQNLVWVGHHKLAPIEPENLEQILGYPVNHTRDPEHSLKERLQALKHCFQTDTLGYHLSVLKSLFPGGLTVLSVYTGFGGAEIALHRLGIHLKCVVSVEPCESKRKILKSWWMNSVQSGELVQIDNIQKLSGNKLETLIKKVGGFDFIVCQNPYTYSSKSAATVSDSDDLQGLDFSLFCEFVRVVQRVRSIMEINS
ncbi:DNA (cytosine-5-)-methyltransferase [Bertholletia excelsa]